MSPAGFEPATTCTHTGIATILEPLLYHLSYGGTGSNTAGDTFWIVSCVQDACYPNCTRKYYTLKHVQGMYTTCVHAHALQRRIIISHKDFKFIRVDVSVPEIYVLNVDF